jgi:hypothetical protein
MLAIWTQTTPMYVCRIKCCEILVFEKIAIFSLKIVQVAEINDRSMVKKRKVTSKGRIPLCSFMWYSKLASDLSWGRFYETVSAEIDG